MTVADSLIPDARAFLADLARNNNRDWFQDHRDTYDTRLKAPAEALLASLAPPLAERSDAPVATKLFRPQRDVRFSKDKTPYTTWLRMMWTVGGTVSVDPAFFFGIDPDGARAGAGVMEFGKGALDGWRRLIDLDGARIGGIVDRLTARGFAPIAEPDLKRVPAPYAADHPQGALLRRKGFAMMRDVPDTGDLENAILSIFDDTQILVDILSSI